MECEYDHLSASDRIALAIGIMQVAIAMLLAGTNKPEDILADASDKIGEISQSLAIKK